MEKILGLVIMVCCLLFTNSIYAQTLADVEIIHLINTPADYDNSKVCVSGEVIGDIMFRGNKAWINVADSTGVIGVYIDEEEARKIKFGGDYQHKGDKIRITGVFKRDMEIQGGDLGIIGKKLDLLDYGKVIKNNLPLPKMVVSIILGVTALIFWLTRQKIVKNLKV